MLRLRTFQGLSLDATVGVEVDASAHRRRLALLAIIGSAEPTGISRDKVVGLLWPDRDIEKARHSLAQLTYAIKKEWGVAPVVGAADLRLDPAVITSDVGDLRAAAAAGDHASVAALYTGPFLDGVYLSGASEFERWTEEERGRLHGLVRRSLEALAAAADAGTDTGASVRAWQRLAQHDPFDPVAAQGCMEALAAAGNRAGALRHAESYASRMQRELQLPVEPAVTALAERLRRELAEAPPLTVATPRSTDSVAPTGAPVDTASAGETRVANASATPAPSVAHRWTLLLAGTALGLAGVAFWRSRAIATAPGDRVILADVANTSGDTVAASALNAALAVALRQSAGVRPVSASALNEIRQRMRAPAEAPWTDSLARAAAVRDGVRFVVVPTLRREGSRYVLSSRLEQAVDGAVLAVREEAASREELVGAADRLVRRMRRDFGEAASVVRAAPPLPRLTTSSLAALQLYADGARAYRRGEFGVARQLFSAALGQDSLFTLAHSALGAVWSMTNEPDSAAPHLDRALALLDRLPVTEQLLVRAEVTRWRGDWKQAAVLHATYLEMRPDDAEVWELLGYDHLRARDPAAGIAAFTRVARLRPLGAESHLNLAALHRLARQHAAARREYAAAAELDSTVLTRNFLNHDIGRTFVDLGFPDSARQVFALMLTRSANDQARGHRSLAYLDQWQGRLADAVNHFRSAALLSAGQSEAVSEVRSRLLLATTLTELGDSAAARREVGAAVRLAESKSLEAPLYLWTGRLAARLGDRLAARRMRDLMAPRVRPSSVTDQAALDQLDAELLLADRRYADAVPLADRAVTTEFSAYALESLARAQLLAGQLNEAAQSFTRLGVDPTTWFGFEGQFGVRESPYWLGRTEELRGDAAAAARAYDRFLAQWTTAESAMPLVRDARLRFAALRAGPAR